MEVDNYSTSRSVYSIAGDGRVVWDVIFLYFRSIIEMRFCEGKEEGAIFLAVFRKDGDFRSSTDIG